MCSRPKIKMALHADNNYLISRKENVYFQSTRKKRGRAKYEFSFVSATKEGGDFVAKIIQEGLSQGIKYVLLSCSFVFCDVVFMCCRQRCLSFYFWSRSNFEATSLLPQRKYSNSRLFRENATNSHTRMKMELANKQPETVSTHKKLLKWQPTPLIMTVKQS